MAGTIRPLGEALVAPFSRKRAVLYSYEVEHIDSSRRSDLQNSKDFQALGVELLSISPDSVQAWAVLAGEAAERGRTPVLIIDEAHMLDHDQLESIRMMTNHDMDSSTPFATILVGQPTLRHSVKLGVLAALEQRITVRYQMKGMTPDETASYVRHHLEQAGRTAELFTDDAIAQIHQAARGKPRTVNNICTAALIAAAGAGKNLVDHASARAAIAEVTATD